VSANTEFLKQVTGNIAPALKRAGFRKRGNSFNRTVDDGLVHVIEYHMSPWGSGTFTVQVAVYVPGNFLEDLAPVGGWVRDHQCLLMWGVAYLMPAARFRQFDPTVEDAAESEAAVLGPGLARLDSYPNAHRILADYYSSTLEAGLYQSLRPLHVGLIHLHLGETELAEEQVAAHLATLGPHTPKAYVTRLRARLSDFGLSHLPFPNVS